MSSGDRSVSDVLRDIFRDLQEIVRYEIRLAKAEVREELLKAQSASVLVGIAALSGVFSAFFLLLAIVHALSLVMPNWASALIVAMGLAIFAGVTLSVGLRRFKTVSPTQKTIVSLEERILNEPNNPPNRKRHPKQARRFTIQPGRVGK